MKSQSIRLLALAALLSALGPLQAFALTSANVAGTWDFKIDDVVLGFSTEAHYVFKADGTSTSGGMFTVSGDTFTWTVPLSDGGSQVWIATLDNTGTLMTNGMWGTPGSPENTFTATKVGAPPIAKLTFQELDSQYVYRPASGSDTFDFSLFKITVSGSINLEDFPSADPHDLMLSPDTELDITAGGVAIFGGKLSEADPHSTFTHQLFKLLPFAADSFFDPLPKHGPTGYRTGDPTLTIAWFFTGPPNKPTGLRFSIIAVGRAWAENLQSGVGNSQGLAGPDGVANLGKPPQKVVFGTPSGNAVPCTITFADGSRKVTSSFTLAGNAQTMTQSHFDPKLKVELKTSTYHEQGSGPEKPHK